MGEIIPRWEWRTFGDNMDKGEENIKKHPLLKARESAEIYILSEVSMDNTKIRDKLMDIKSLQRVNDDLLEQWLPIMKGAFPLPIAEIEKVFQSFKVSLPQTRRDEYTLDQFLDELVQPEPRLKAVDVVKKRSGYTINDCIVEIAEVKGNTTWTRTIAVEQEDPQKVLETVRELGLTEFENINYLKALKKIVGMKY